MKLIKEEDIGRWSGITMTSIQMAAAHEIPFIDVLCAAILLMRDHSHEPDLAEYLQHFLELSRNLEKEDTELGLTACFDGIWEVSETAYEESKEVENPDLPGITFEEHRNRARRVSQTFSMEEGVLQSAYVAGMMIGIAQASGMDLLAVGYLLSGTFSAAVRAGQCSEKQLVEYAATVSGHPMTLAALRMSYRIAVVRGSEILPLLDKRIEEMKDAES